MSTELAIAAVKATPAIVHEHSGPCPVAWCSQGHPCRICGASLTPEHVHPEYAAFRGEDGY